jgi:hypothetical protein
VEDISFLLFFLTHHPLCLLISSTPHSCKFSYLF